MSLRFELAAFAALLAVLNIPLLAGGSPGRFNLDPAALAAGEWWRWLTFPWAHVSPYHLLVDAAAFLTLWAGLRAPLSTRCRHLALTAFFSGAVPLLLDRRVQELGLGGLSGVAHGLMLLAALEAAARPEKEKRALGVLYFAVVLCKTLFEQFSGQVLFAQLHPGSIGTPIPACHLGGLIGALASAAISLFAKKIPRVPHPFCGNPMPRLSTAQFRPRSPAHE